MQAHKASSFCMLRFKSEHVMVDLLKRSNQHCQMAFHSNSQTLEEKSSQQSQQQSQANHHPFHHQPWFGHHRDYYDNYYNYDYKYADQAKYGSQQNDMVIQHLLSDIRRERKRRKAANFVVLVLLILLGIVVAKYKKLIEKYKRRLGFEDLNELFRKEPSSLDEWVPEFMKSQKTEAKTSSGADNVNAKGVVDVNSEEIKKWIQVAKNLRSEKEYDDAIRVLENILWKYPSVFTARELYGQVLLDKGLYRSALKQFEQAAIYADSPSFESSCYNNMGVSLSRLKKHKEAVEILDKAIATAPFDSKNRGLYYFNRAISHQHLGNYKMAVSDYSRSIQMDESQDPTALSKKLRQRAICFNSLKQYQKAIDDYTQCLQCEEKLNNPSLKADVLFYRGLDHRKLKNFSEALNDLDKAIQLRKEAIYFHARAITYRKLGEFDKAIEDHKMANSLKPNNTKLKESYNKTLLAKDNKQ